MVNLNGVSLASMLVASPAAAAAVAASHSLNEKITAEDLKKLDGLKWSYHVKESNTEASFELTWPTLALHSGGCGQTSFNLQTQEIKKMACSSGGSQEITINKDGSYTNTVSGSGKTTKTTGNDIKLYKEVLKEIIDTIRSGVPQFPLINQVKAEQIVQYLHGVLRQLPK